jgi:hypothetical protein
MVILSAVVVIVVVLGIAFVIWIGSPMGPKLEQVAHRKEPRLTTMDSQKVLVVVARGDPSIVGKKAFALLMKTRPLAEAGAGWPMIAPHLDRRESCSRGSLPSSPFALP